MANTKNRREYRIPCEDWEATQVERSVHIIDRATGKTIKVIPVPKAWGDEWGWNFIEGGIAIERSPQHEAPPAGRSRAVAIAALARRRPMAGEGPTVVTTKQAEEVLPLMRAAVAALHEVWEKCREVERVLGRDLDGLEGVIQNIAAGVDDPESVDVQYVQDALSAELGETVDKPDACPACGEQRTDAIVWQDDGTVRCSICGKTYRPGR